ncbi:MAG: AzlD domain-containing protein [Syntrophales bacterium]|nr:AzlD domain-containing protein [Syntrophales bacterium]MCK9528393.1 AzlD domain-containing protein [Syntrophales bacterium]MDX9922682.1 AzlD domain-containing protein [Syntrophales bacterium]
MSAIFVTIVFMALITYFTRSIVFIADFRIPDEFEKFLRYIPFAILSTLIFPSLLVRDGTLLVTTDNHHLMVGIVAIGIAAVFRKPVVTVFCGMALMLALKGTLLMY